MEPMERISINSSKKSYIESHIVPSMDNEESMHGRDLTVVTDSQNHQNRISDEEKSISTHIDIGTHRRKAH